MGIADAWSFWHMEPVEINGRLSAHTANRKRHEKELDLLAWMIGDYTARGYHEPKKYPRSPNKIKDTAPMADMEEEDLKTVLSAYAELHNETVRGDLSGNHP